MVLIVCRYTSPNPPFLKPVSTESLSVLHICDAIFANHPRTACSSSSSNLLKAPPASSRPFQCLLKLSQSSLQSSSQLTSNIFQSSFKPEVFFCCWDYRSTMLEHEFINDPQHIVLRWETDVCGQLLILTATLRGTFPLKYNKWVWKALIKLR